MTLIEIIRAAEEALRNDKEVAGQTLKRNLTKVELTAKLRGKGIMATGSLKALKKLCDQNGMPTSEYIPKIQQGWVGKQKGLLQILWERGWVDISRLGKYTIDGSKDGFGIKQLDTSLKFLMANCVDFEEEESLLQSMGTKMGVIIDRTPKCHCELAGEGIEYSWGCAKNEYRRKPLSSKRKKETWRQTVRECLSREVLTTERIRKFSRRAREYIVAYHLLSATGSSIDVATVEPSPGETPVKVEKLLKEFKTHRSASDFAKGFITSVMN